MFFAYDWSTMELVYPKPSGKGHDRIPTAVLRENGYIADDAEMRRSLPRADASRIARLR